MCSARTWAISAACFGLPRACSKNLARSRVFDTPLAEGGIIGVAIGMSINGLRPVPEIQFSDYMYPAFDQITNELAKLRYRSGGEWTAPMTIRSPSGGGIRGGLYHSQSPEAYYAHTPGLCVVMPSNPHDAKGCSSAALSAKIRSYFFEPKRLYRGPFDGDPATRAAVARAARSRVPD